MCGHPLIPLLGMERYTTSQAQAAVTYYGSDMNLMMLYGEDDEIFPPDESEALYDKVFEKLGIASTIKYDTTKSSTGHVEDPLFFFVMMSFVRDGTISSVSDYEDDFAATLGLFVTLAVMSL